MKVFYTRTFQEDYTALPNPVRAQADRQLDLFIANPRHPSLRVKKIRGTARSIWEGRVSQGYRFTFEWEGDRVTLRRLGLTRPWSGRPNEGPDGVPTGEGAMRSK